MIKPVTRYRYTVSFVEAVLRTGSLAFDRVLDLYVSEATGINLQDKVYSALEPTLILPVDATLNPANWPINLSNLRECKCRIFLCHNQPDDFPAEHKLFEVIFEMIGDWLIGRRQVTSNTASHHYKTVEIGFARLMRPSVDPANPYLGPTIQLVFDIKDPLVLLAARKYFELSFPNFITTAIEYDLVYPTQGGASMDKAVAYYLTKAFDRTKRFSDVFQFPTSVAGSWTTLSGRLVAMYKDISGTQRVVPASWNNGVHTSLAQWTYSGGETVSWFEHAEGIPVIRPDEHMNPDVMALILLSNGQYLWLGIHVELRRSAFKLPEVLGAAHDLKPCNWWRVDVRVLSPGFDN